MSYCLLSRRVIYGSLRMVAAILFFACLSVISAAQVSITGKITGTITDPSGAAVPNASVTVSGPALMAARSTHTQPDGTYLFDLLPPGTYSVTTTATGFRKVEQTGVIITAGFTATVNAKLQVGQVTETLNVESMSSTVDLQNV